MATPETTKALAQLSHIESRLTYEATRAQSTTGPNDAVFQYAMAATLRALLVEIAGLREDLAKARRDA